MSAAAQAAEGLCLKFPNELGIHREITLEQAVLMLGRATTMAATMPFQWGFIDQPKEGQIYLIFLPSQTPFPNDGVRFLEAEQKWNMPAPGGKELEIHESKFGFVPNSSDQNAWRLRRRFRLTKGGHPQLMLVHYSRGQPIPITPSLMTQPVRTYPLRTVHEPGVFVAGERTGMKVTAGGGGGGMAPPVPGPPVGPMNINMGMNLHQQQAMLAQQNTNMEMLERKRREQAMASAPRPGAPPRADEIEDADETDSISSRALALARYSRNHDFMNDVFRHAAYGGKHTPARPRPYAAFDVNEIEEKSAKLEEEIEALKARSIGRQAMVL